MRCFFFTVFLTFAQAILAGGPLDGKGGGWGHHGGGLGGNGAGHGNSFNPQIINKPSFNPQVTSNPTANSKLILQNGAIQGGTIARGAVSNTVTGLQTGAVQNRVQAVGSTHVSGIGNTSINYPRQTPMAYAPSSYSANPCIMNYSAGGSGAPFGFSLGISAESSACNTRADSIRFAELGLPKVACERMLEEDENIDAMKRAGANCKDAVVPYPQESNFNPGDYYTKPEVDQRLNGLFDHAMVK